MPAGETTGVPERLILDCDPGHDDMAAILLALRHPRLRPEAVTTVAGNAPLEKTTRNALRILRAVGSDVPVHAGAARPLVRDPVDALSFHGESGLDTVGEGLPSTETGPDPEGAAETLLRRASGAPGELTLVVTGPMTNVALALRLRPGLAQQLKRIVFMGGSAGPGNVTAAAEFNIWADAEAARIVLESGVPLVMMGLHLTHQVRLTRRHVERVRRGRSPIAGALADLLSFYLQTTARHFGEEEIGAPLHDPCAVAFVAAPELFELEPMEVRVETRGEQTYGMTVCDGRRMPADRESRRPNVQVAMRVDAEAVLEMVVRALGG
ncbi:nucleoside hydrolase [Limnochorda pilosa]|uniref:Inosine/uridine-preferring nucleoside hydrolase domain-containing protein n=1 Tax=Limnochorda pilosa TaxID=1555112 RepID=A0A0K2SLD4_LIMPI|nr:nucleoside hydrolase [Limnochorda pilosa]BAS27812.1 hypothetical protein LIP_1971 [Limnochorda pilosa]